MGFIPPIIATIATVAITASEVASVVAPLATVVGGVATVGGVIGTAVEEHKQTAEAERQTRLVAETEATARHNVDLQRSLAHRRAIQDAILRAQNKEQMINRSVRESGGIDPFSLDHIRRGSVQRPVTRNEILRANRDYFSNTRF